MGKDAIVMQDRDGFWGGLDQQRGRGYFNGLVRYLIDAGGYWDRLHIKPPGYPFLVLGLPALQMQANGMCYHRRAIDILGCGIRLENLASRLRLLAAEGDLFCVQRELCVPRERAHVEG
jgi:hypothetical protein